jgi:ABC-type branched-subunit amino acid transport system ATPase component
MGPSHLFAGRPWPDLLGGRVLGLEAKDVQVRFGGLVALDGVSITAPSHVVTGLIGPNGAGKTTFFNVCSGYQVAQHESTTLDGVEITGMGAVARARAGIGRTFQRLELFWRMTVLENIELAVEAQSTTDSPLSLLNLRPTGRRKASDIRDTADEYLRLLGLSEKAETPAGQLSTGQGRLLELARCLAREPKMLLLDEPSSGLDKDETASFGEIIQKVVSEKGVGVLLVEHDMSLVLRICGRITVLDFGKMLFEGTPSEVSGSSEVQAAYLGRVREAV